MRTFDPFNERDHPIRDWWDRFTYWLEGLKGARFRAEREQNELQGYEWDDCPASWDAETGEC